MNEDLRKQLSDPQARQRHEAIVQLARAKDEDALPLLNTIAKTDPEPQLRQLAERAINHILNEFSSTISRKQPETPSQFPPFSNRDAENHLQQAYQQQKSGANANALQYLIKALELAPYLAGDFDVQELAHTLTGRDGILAVQMILDPRQRQELFTEKKDDNPPRNGLPKSPRSWIILLLTFIALGNLFLADGVEIINNALEDIELQKIKQSKYSINGDDYYLVLPEQMPQSGYPVLIALPDGREDTSAMLRYFADTTQELGVMLVVPDFIDYRYRTLNRNSEQLQAILNHIDDSFRIHHNGVVLFGYEDGAMVATYYANHHTDTIASVITSGGTYLYPPADESIRYVIMYGEDDELLHGATDNNVMFADVKDWSTPLNYLIIEKIGHEINSQQTDIALQVLKDSYFS